MAVRTGKICFFFKTSPPLPTLHDTGVFEYIVQRDAHHTSSSHYIYTFLLRRLHEAIFIFFIHWKYTICIIMSGNLSFDVSFARNPSSEKLIKKKNLTRGDERKEAEDIRENENCHVSFQHNLELHFNWSSRRFIIFWATIVDRTLFGIFMKCESSILTMTA